MSDTPPAQPPATEPPADPPADPAKQDTTDWKSEARKWETRAKENSSAAARLKELEDAQKTEIQKATDAATAAEAKAAEAELRATRIEVAAAAGLTAAQARRLVGTTREELEADAKELAKDLGTIKPADLKQGQRGKSTPDLDADAWIRRAAGR